MTIANAAVHEPRTPAPQIFGICALGAVAAIVLFLPKRGLRFAGVLITLYANYQVGAAGMHACTRVCV